MNKYWDIFVEGYSGYAQYLKNEITNPTWNSYFYWLIAVSLFFLLLELITPWRKDQKLFRKDFWLDTFYMFFNFFLFSLIIYNAASAVVVNLFNDIVIQLSGFDLQKSNPLNHSPYWLVLVVGFLVRDFVQWWIHRLLHRIEFLWEFHKVHHSVEEMGFAAHLRYHWMENVVYRSLEYLPLALMGIGLYDFFVIHIFTLAWGHYNHSNLTIDRKITGGLIGLLIGIVLAYNLLETNLIVNADLTTQLLIIISSLILGALILGPIMPRLFNSPEMHIWHHAYEIPEERRFGVNFGLTLALWDYLFGTAYIPHEGKTVRLGFPGVEDYPKDIVSRNISNLVRYCDKLVTRFF